MRVTRVTISEVYQYNKIELTVEFSEEEGRDLEFVQKEIEKLRKIARSEVRKPLLTKDAEMALSELKRKPIITRDDILSYPDRILFELIANNRLVWEDGKWIVK